MVHPLRSWKYQQFWLQSERCIPGFQVMACSSSGSWKNNLKRVSAEAKGGFRMFEVAAILSTQHHPSAKKIRISGARIYFEDIWEIYNRGLIIGCKHLCPRNLIHQMIIPENYQNKHCLQYIYWNAKSFQRATPIWPIFNFHTFCVRCIINSAQQVPNTRPEPKYLPIPDPCPICF